MIYVSKVCDVTLSADAMHVASGKLGQLPRGLSRYVCSHLCHICSKRAGLTYIGWQGERVGCWWQPCLRLGFEYGLAMEPELASLWVALPLVPHCHGVDSMVIW
jgi:hypothetical protein